MEHVPILEENFLGQNIYFSMYIEDKFKVVWWREILFSSFQFNQLYI